MRRWMPATALLASQSAACKVRPQHLCLRLLPAGGKLLLPACSSKPLRLPMALVAQRCLPPAMSCCAESLSLSHAVSVVLSRLFEERQRSSSYALPQGRADLAAGFEETGVER